MSLKLYYLSVLTAHTLLTITSGINLYQIDNVEPTLANNFLLYFMLSVSGVYFIADVLYMAYFYRKQYKEFIIHHLLYLVMLYLNTTNTSFRYMRYIFSSVLISETSSILLDIEALYKLYKNPNADPMAYHETTAVATPYTVYIKSAFFVVFLTVRYVFIPKIILKICMEPWSVYETRLLVLNVLAYSSMHVFWLYKIMGYFLRKCRKQR